MSASFEWSAAGLSEVLEKGILRLANCLKIAKARGLEKEFMHDDTSQRNWLDYAALLREAQEGLEFQRCLEITGEPLPKFPEAMFHLDSGLSENVEAAVRQFARTKTWPELSPAESVCIDARLHFATWQLLFCQEYGVSKALVDGAVTPDIPEEEAVLEWMLITLWNKHGRTHMVSSAKCFVRCLGYSR